MYIFYFYSFNFPSNFQVFTDSINVENTNNDKYDNKVWKNDRYSDEIAY